MTDPDIIEFTEEVTETIEFVDVGPQGPPGDPGEGGSGDLATHVAETAADDDVHGAKTYTDAVAATKANASHPHASSDVTGLDAALAAKQDASTAATDAELTAGLATKQSTSEKAQANGYASLDGGGKIPATQLPNSVMEFQGMWNASTNTPTLADGTGNPGDVYRVSNAGSVDLGSGAIAFKVNDQAVYGADGKWYRSRATDDVTSVAGKTGDVSLASGDVSGLGSAATKDSGAAGAAGKVLNADDASTANARTPTAHKSSHATGGSDALAPSDIGAAPLDSPTFTGNPQAPTPSTGDNDESIATTAFVETRAGLLIPSSAIDTDGTLADNSDAKIASQKATRTAIEARSPLVKAAAKSADQGVTNSNAEQDDDHLVLALSVGTWVVDLSLLTSGATTASDWLFQLTFSGIHSGSYGPIMSGANSMWGANTLAQSPAALYSYGAPFGVGAATVTGGLIIRGVIVVTDAGDLRLRWAQQTATAAVTNTLRAGSSMIATKTA